MRRTHPWIWIALVTAGLSLCTTAHADYSPPPLYDMILASDLVAVGSIEALTDKTYTFKIEQHLHGDAAGGSITVKRFSDWECARRWAPYRIGQRFMLFADRTDRTRAKVSHASKVDFLVRSAGGEGEMPIVGSDVIVGYHGIGSGPSSSHAIPETIHGHRFALSQWIQTLATMHRLYEVKRGFSDRKTVWRQVVSIRKIGSPAQFKASKGDPVVVKMVEDLDRRISFMR